MTKNFQSKSSRFFQTDRRRTLALVALLALLVAGWVTAAGSGGGGGEPGHLPEDIGGRWEETLTAQITPNTCHEEGLKCAEWCTFFQGGSTRGSGILCCIEPGEVGSSTNFDSCQGLR